MSRVRRLGRFLRLWPGAWFTWPERPLSVRMANWLLRDHYVPAIRTQLYEPSALWSWVTERRP